MVDRAGAPPGILVVFLGIGGEEVRLSAEVLSEVGVHSNVCIALKARIWRAACEAVPGFGCWRESKTSTDSGIDAEEIKRNAGDDKILATWMELVRAPAFGGTESPKYIMGLGLGLG